MEERTAPGSHGAKEDEGCGAALATDKKLEQLANGWRYPATRNAAMVRRGGMMKGVPLSEALRDLTERHEVECINGLAMRRSSYLRNINWLFRQERTAPFRRSDLGMRSGSPAEVDLPSPYNNWFAIVFQGDPRSHAADSGGESSSVVAATERHTTSSDVPRPE
jgi:hypothetical protein